MIDVQFLLPPEQQASTSVLVVEDLAEELWGGEAADGYASHTQRKQKR